MQNLLIPHNKTPYIKTKNAIKFCFFIITLTIFMHHVYAAELVNEQENSQNTNFPKLSNKISDHDQTLKKKNMTN